MAETVKEDSWYGLYAKGWGNTLVEGSMSHPAKVRPALALKIYEHAFAEGWLEEGSTVIDPFAGIGGFAFHALQKGLNWIGFELEPRFVTLLNQNVEYWQRKYAPAFPRWGEAHVYQGDSRYLSLLLSLRANGAVSSPPYVGTLSNGEGPGARYDFKSHSPENAVKQTSDPNYGNTEGQLGAMSEGSVEAVVSSPPYATGSIAKNSSGIDRRKQYETYKASGGGASYEAFCATQDAHSFEYGETPGQLQTLPSGNVDAVITSPPFGAGDTRDRYPAQEGEIASNLTRAYTMDRQGADAGNLARMDSQCPPHGMDAVVSSPPYETQGVGHDTGHPRLDDKEDERREKEGCTRRPAYGQLAGQLAAMPAGCVSSPPFAGSIGSDDPDKRGGLFRDPKRRDDVNLTGEYGDTEGQLGKMDEGLDAVVSSPPYAETDTRPTALGSGAPTRATGESADRNKGDYHYPETPGQLGKMDGSVSSPPYITGGGHKHQMDAWNTNDGGQFGPEHRGYGDETSGQVQGYGRSQQGLDTFWSAARAVVAQVYDCLAPGAHAIWVVKAYVRDKQVVDFPGQWQALCESVGFKTEHIHKAWMTEGYGVQLDLFGGEVEQGKAHKSFFRRLYESKYPENRIDYEIVLCMSK